LAEAGYFCHSDEQSKLIRHPAHGNCSTMTDLLCLMSIITLAYMLACLAVGHLGLAVRSVQSPEN